jgi:uncharacterized membrane protein
MALCQFLLAFLTKQPIIQPMEQVKAVVGAFPLSGKSLVVLPVGLLLFAWLFNTPAGLLGKADAIGYAVCHRIDLRSFHIGERPMPLCARCSGMYLGAVLALTYQRIRGARRGGMPSRKVWAAFALFVLAFAMDGINSFLHLPLPGFVELPTLYEPQNWTRLLTGTGMGLVMAGAIYPVFNQTVWKRWDPSPALPGLRSLGLLVFLALIMDLVVLAEIPWILYLLALVSAAGVLILLSLVYTMMWLMITRGDNSAVRARQLVLPLIAGFGAALLQIALIDLARFAMTGTWEGFHFG